MANIDFDNLINNRSEFAPSASEDIANNNLQILSRPKYAKVIKTTVILTKPNGIASVFYLDEHGKTIAGPFHRLSGDFPVIGEVVEEA